MIRKEGKMEQKRQINKHWYSGTQFPQLLSNKYSDIWTKGRNSDCVFGIRLL